MKNLLPGMSCMIIISVLVTFLADFTPVCKLEHK